MIGLSSPEDTIEPRLSDAPGGFYWWYLDLVDPQGDGLVLIWSQNLPFLPDVAYGLRSGGLPLPRAHPSLNVVVHQGGRPAFYALQQHPEDAWSWDPSANRWRIGRSTLALTVDEAGAATLEADLDCPIPATGDRLRGTVRVSGRRRQPGATVRRTSPHLWCPLMTATTGSASLSWGRGSAELTGRAYLDRNESDTALPHLGIDRWWWGRIPLQGRELIYYRVDGETERRELVLEVRDDGSSRLADQPAITLGPNRLGRYGLPHPRTVSFQDPDGQPVSVAMQHMVEDGPFYQRFVVAAEAAGERATGVAELVAPQRIALPGFRPLIEMRVHRVGAPNSFWLPLFTGGRPGRVGRLLGQLRGPRALPEPSLSPDNG